MYKMMFNHYCGGFYIINLEYESSDSDPDERVFKFSFKGANIDIFCLDDEGVQILEALRPSLSLLAMNVLQPFESMALDLIARHKNSAFLVIGQSLKLLKWALKHHLSEPYVAALTVSGVDTKHAPSPEFLEYLKGKLTKLGNAKAGNVVIIDYANKGETLRALKRDIRKSSEVDVYSIAYISGGSVGREINKEDELKIDEVIALPNEISALIDHQDLKDVVGRNKTKVPYKDWKKYDPEVHGEALQRERYQQLKKSYLDKVKAKDINELTDGFMKCIKEAEGYFKDDVLYSSES